MTATMKTLRSTVGLLLAFCVAFTVSQTTSTPDPSDIDECFLRALLRFGLTDPTCAEELQGALDVTEEALDVFCPRACSGVANEFFDDACDFPISETICSQNEGNTTYCVTTESINDVATMVGEILGGPCLNTNCSDTTCNAAIGNLTCCVTTIQRYFEGVTGLDSPLVLPGGCTIEQCPRPPLGPGSGAASFAALPTVIFVSMLTALVACFGLN